MWLRKVADNPGAQVSEWVSGCIRIALALAAASEAVVATYHDAGPGKQWSKKRKGVTKKAHKE